MRLFAKLAMAALCLLAFSTISQAKSSHRHHRHHVHHSRHAAPHAKAVRKSAPVLAFDNSGRWPVADASPARFIEGVAQTASNVGAGRAQRPARLVTVPTAAGISITVASSVAQRFVGFIADLVASGARPSTIHCAASGGHVRHSLHYWGGACDFNGSASRWAPMNHFRAADLARKWDLRDGCSFRIRRGVPDCGHIDAGVPAHRDTRYAKVGT